MRGNRDVVLSAPGWKESAGHATPWVFKGKGDARPRACVPTDAVVTLLQEPTLRTYCNRGGDDTPGVGVKDSDVELEGDFSETSLNVQRHGVGKQM